MPDPTHDKPINRLRNLVQAYTALERDAPEIAVTILDEMDKRLSSMLERKMSCESAYTLFTSLPRSVLEAALTNRGPTSFRDLAHVCSQAFPQVRVLPTGLGQLSKPALDRLVALGFPYDDVVGDSGPKLWLTRGASFGKAAFRKRHPRKNPVMAYWEDNGLRLPAEGLCAEGVVMVAEQIRTLQEKPPTRAFIDAVRQRVVEPRILIAFLASGPNCPDCLKDRLMWHRTLGETRAKDLADLFSPQASRHAELGRQARLAASPSIEDILSRESLPASFSELFPFPEHN